MNRRAEGSAHERQAAAYLEERGLKILEYNYRTARGEIDLIARDRDMLVFVEVKYRRDSRMGYPEEGGHPRQAEDDPPGGGGLPVRAGRQRRPGLPF